MEPQTTEKLLYTGERKAYSNMGRYAPKRVIQKGLDLDPKDDIEITQSYQSILPQI